MAFLLIVLAIFVVVSIYFYFRSERLAHELVQQKRESAVTRKENKQLADMFAVVALKQEELYQFRFNKLRERAEKEAPSVASDMALVSPLVNNFANVYRGCSTGTNQLKVVSQQCFENYKTGSFKEFLRFISGQEKHIKRMWGTNNLVGFLSTMEALLTEFQSDIKKVKEKKEAAENIETMFKKAE